LSLHPLDLLRSILRSEGLLVRSLSTARFIVRTPPGLNATRRAGRCRVIVSEINRIIIIHNWFRLPVTLRKSRSTWKRSRNCCLFNSHSSSDNLCTAAPDLTQHQAVAILCRLRPRRTQASHSYGATLRSPTVMRTFSPISCKTRRFSTLLVQIRLSLQPAYTLPSLYLL
jgi:hypothetical protein